MCVAPVGSGSQQHQGLLGQRLPQVRGQIPGAVCLLRGTAAWTMGEASAGSEAWEDRRPRGTASNSGRSPTRLDFLAPLWESGDTFEEAQLASGCSGTDETR